MTNVLLVLVLLGQDADVAVTGHGRRTGGEYELTVSGKGKTLQDQEIVSLRFRRVVNRLNWDDGALVTVPLDDETGRVAYVENNAFVHRERFATAGEVEVRIGRSHPDGAPPEGRQIRRVFRVSSLPEEAQAIDGAAKKVASAIRGVRLLLEDIDQMKGECPAARKQTRLQKRFDWRKNAYRGEIAECFLTASAHALSLLMADVEAAQDLERTGKGTASMVSSLTGKPFAWEDVRTQLESIEAASLRERGLLIAGTIAGMAAEIEAAVRSAQTGVWVRAEREVSRTIVALREAEPAPEGTLDGLMTQIEGYAQAGAACIRCSESDEGRFTDLGKALAEKLEACEQQFRLRN